MANFLLFKCVVFLLSISCDFVYPVLDVSLDGRELVRVHLKQVDPINIFVSLGIAKGTHMHQSKPSKAILIQARKVGTGNQSSLDEAIVAHEVQKCFVQHWGFLLLRTRKAL